MRSSLAVRYYNCACVSSLTWTVKLFQMTGMLSQWRCSLERTLLRSHATSQRTSLLSSVSRAVYFALEWHRDVNRVTTCLENLEMSGNLTAVKEMSGILLKVRELSGKKSCEGKVEKLAAYLHPFLTLLGLCISFWFQIMHCWIPTPPLTITLVQAWYEWHLTWAGVPWTVREFHIVWRVVINNNNKHDNVYGAVIMAEPLREFTRFIWWM